MNRYVRTKCGVFTFEQYLAQNTLQKAYHELLVGSSAGYKDIEILKEANNIEELCDELVGVDNGIAQFPVVLPKNQVAKNYLLANFKKQYGAIWADGGLIYVAEFNSKGELELL